MRRIEIEVPTSMPTIAEQTRDMLQRIVDIVGEKDLPRVLAYVQKDPKRLEKLFRNLLLVL